MTARRPVLSLMIAGLTALVLAGPTLAASPQKIYKDLADNGRLDGRYRQADIARAFNVERVMGTDRPTTPSRRPAVVATAPSRTSAEGGRKLPFSGLDLGLLVAGGAPLLLIGLGLRRRITAHPRGAGVVGS
jgi:hypothetical protein